MDLITQRGSRAVIPAHLVWVHHYLDSHLGGETLRTLRAIQVLERIGTKAAGEVLRKLATAAEAARETQEAKEALERLSRRTTPDR